MRSAHLLSSVAASAITAHLGGGSVPPVDYAPHRYWRIVALESQGPTEKISGFTYIEFFGANEFLSKFALNTATVSADSEYSAQDQAIDAINHPQELYGWASQATPHPHWWKVDFGAGNEKAVYGVRLFGRNQGLLSSCIKSFELQYSDDNTAWTTVMSVSGITWSSSRQMKVYYRPAYSPPSYSGSPHGSHLYWRLAIDGVQNSAVAAAVGEVEFRATPGGADLCSGGTATADAIFSGSYPASNAFDNNDATLWSSTNKGSFNTAWLKYQFAAPVSVAEVAVKARSDGFSHTSPREIKVQWSDDNVVWTTAWSIENQTSWSVSQLRVFTDPKYI